MSMVSLQLDHTLKTTRNSGNSSEYLGMVVQKLIEIYLYLVDLSRFSLRK